jgi:hypothetical protein
MNGDEDTTAANHYVCFVPTKLHRVRTARGERLTLLAPDYTVTIELTIRGLELDQARIEQMLHAPLGVLVGQGRETI